MTEEQKKRKKKKKKKDKKDIVKAKEGKIPLKFQT